jgi:hypothetical protein
MLAQPLQSGAFSGGFPERIKEADNELKAIVTLQNQVDEKSRRLAGVWVSILRQVGLTVQVKKEAFGFQFGVVDEARLDPEGMVRLKISGDEMSYPLVDLPSESITAVVSNSAPELLLSLREMVKAETAGVVALERIALEFDKGLNGGVRRPATEESREGNTEHDPPMVLEERKEIESARQSGPKASGKKRGLADTDHVPESNHYAFNGSFGEPKVDATGTSSCGNYVSL